VNSGVALSRPVSPCRSVLLAKLKPAFINHPRCKDLLRNILAEFGCDLEKTYFDVPRLRTSTADGYLTSGIAYAFHPHRDTWYSAPQCQLNWWFPVYDIEPSNGMAFHPQYWSKGCANSSRIYNYDEWNAHSRKEAAKQHLFGYPPTITRRRAARSRARHPAGSVAGGPHHVLGSPTPLDGGKYVWKDAFLDRLSTREHR
jgi:hypothetical protein